jgi:hypothetical protein
MPDFHPQEWITIVEALSVYDQWLEREERSERIFELQLAIAREHGFESPMRSSGRGVTEHRAVRQIIMIIESNFHLGESSSH